MLLNVVCLATTKLDLTTLTCPHSTMTAQNTDTDAQAPPSIPPSPSVFPNLSLDEEDGASKVARRARLTQYRSKDVPIYLQSRFIDLVPDKNATGISDLQFLIDSTDAKTFADWNSALTGIRHHARSAARALKEAEISLKCDTATSRDTETSLTAIRGQMEDVARLRRLTKNAYRVDVFAHSETARTATHLLHEPWRTAKKTTGYRDSVNYSIRDLFLDTKAMMLDACSHSLLGTLETGKKA